MRGRCSLSYSLLPALFTSLHMQAGVITLSRFRSNFAASYASRRAADCFHNRSCARMIY